MSAKIASDGDVDARFWMANASSIDLENDACTVVNCLDVVIYLPDKSTFLNEVHTVLEPGGLCRIYGPRTARIQPTARSRAIQGLSSPA